MSDDLNPSSVRGHAVDSNVPGGPGPRGENRAAEADVTIVRIRFGKGRYGVCKSEVLHVTSTVSSVSSAKCGGQLDGDLLRKGDVCESVVRIRRFLETVSNEVHGEYPILEEPDDVDDPERVAPCSTEVIRAELVDIAWIVATSDARVGPKW